MTVVGAGFSGLASAFYLSRAGFQVHVIESSDRIGGMISTVRTSWGLVETAANGILNSALVEELFGLSGVSVTPTLRTARKRYIFRDGWPRRWPVSVAATLRLVFFGFLYFVARPMVAPREKESVRDWAKRVVGREAGAYLIEAALQGVYAGDPSRMSARLVFARFFKRGGSGSPPAESGIRGTVSAPDGMGELLQALHRKLESQGVQFTFSQPMAPLMGAPSHPFVIATPAPVAGELLDSVDSVRAKALTAIEMLPLVSATVCFRERPPETRGFGCLFPPIEGRRALGVLMNGEIFPHRQIRGFSETWILGGARAGATELVESALDADIVELAAEERQATMNASGEVVGYHLSRWPQALPHYTRELEASLPELRGLRSNVVLIGNYLGGIGLARILERAARLPELIDGKGEWAEESRAQA